MFQCRLAFAGFLPPPHRAFAAHWHLVSRQVAGQWKLALLMLLATELIVRFTSVDVKPKAYIYNDLTGGSQQRLQLAIAGKRRLAMAECRYSRVALDCLCSREDSAHARELRGYSATTSPLATLSKYSVSFRMSVLATFGGSGGMVAT